MAREYFPKVSRVDVALTLRARERNPRVFGWYSIRGGSRRKMIVCNLCDLIIDTMSANYPMPKHAADAIDEHGNGHLRAMAGVEDVAYRLLYVPQRSK
jgi:hypothetical protein